MFLLINLLLSNRMENSAFFLICARVVELNLVMLIFSMTLGSITRYDALIHRKVSSEMIHI